MDVDCEACGHRQTVNEADVARAPVELRCARCGESWIVTKSGRSIAPPKPVASDEPVDLAAIADSDDERLPDLASIAAQSNAGRASRVELDELVDVPPSVRATIRASLPPAASSAPVLAVALDPPASAPSGRHPRPGKLAVGLAAVAVIAAVAIGHLSVSSEAAGVERIVATPFAPAPHGPLGPAEIVGAAEASAVATPGADARPDQESDARVTSDPRLAHPGRDRAEAPPAKRATAKHPAAASSVTRTGHDASPRPAPVNLMQAMQNEVRNGRR
jgi:predicted Zn finger-like uncharacterized protein